MVLLSLSFRHIFFRNLSSCTVCGACQALLRPQAFDNTRHLKGLKAQYSILQLAAQKFNTSILECRLTGPKSTNLFRLRLRKLDCVVLLTSSVTFWGNLSPWCSVFNEQSLVPLPTSCVCLCLCTPFYCFQLISLSLISYSTQVPEVLMFFWAEILRSTMIERQAACNWVMRSPSPSTRRRRRRKKKETLVLKERSETCTLRKWLIGGYQSTILTRSMWWNLY